MPKSSVEAGTAKAAERDADTRQRLFAAAADLFAERPFRQVTVRLLCRRAEANLSAVNYHFGDKLGLYREVVGRALDSFEGDAMIDVGDELPAEERLRHYVSAYVPRLVSPKGRAAWLQKVMRHEMNEPTPLAPWIAERAILPRVRFLQTAIAELLDCPPDDPRVVRCTISLQAQCVFYMPNNFRKTAFPEWREMTSAEVEEAAVHIADFTLAGIRALRESS